MAEQSLIEFDALEFGQHVKLGGWRLGLLVARNVEKSKAGRPAANRNNCNDFKMSATKFAELAGVSTPKVLRYLDAWNKAAADIEELPSSDELAPGNEIDLSEEWCEAHPWSAYYSTANKKPDEKPEGTPPSQEEQNRTFRETITRDPEFAKAAAEALREVAPETQQVTADQVREAVRTNPEVEEAAREEAFNRLRERVREENHQTDPTIPNPDDRAPEANPTRQSQDMLRFIGEMKKAERSLRDALYLAQQIEEPIDGTTAVSGIRDYADQIEITLTAGGIDTELVNLIQGEDNGTF